MTAFVLSPAARRDLHDIWDYIAQDNLSAADQLIDRFEEAMATLANMPGMGHEQHDLADETLRIWPVNSYLIIYRPRSTPLQIVRVVSGFRDLTIMPY